MKPEPAYQLAKALSAIKRRGGTKYEAEQASATKIDDDLWKDLYPPSKESKNQKAKG